MSQDKRKKRAKASSPSPEPTDSSEAHQESSDATQIVEDWNVVEVIVFSQNQNEFIRFHWSHLASGLAINHWMFDKNLSKLFFASKGQWSTTFTPFQRVQPRCTEAVDVIWTPDTCGLRRIQMTSLRLGRTGTEQLDRNQQHQELKLNITQSSMVWVQYLSITEPPSVNPSAPVAPVQGWGQRSHLNQGGSGFRTV